MLVSTADLRVPPPPRRAVLRASAVTAAAMAATALTHGVPPLLRTGPIRAAPLIDPCAVADGHPSYANGAAGWVPIDE